MLIYAGNESTKLCCCSWEAIAFSPGLLHTQSMSRQLEAIAQYLAMRFYSAAVQHNWKGCPGLPGQMCPNVSWHWEFQQQWLWGKAGVGRHSQTAVPSSSSWSSVKSHPRATSSAGQNTPKSSCAVPLPGLQRCWYCRHFKRNRELSKLITSAATGCISLQVYPWMKHY